MINPNLLIPSGLNSQFTSENLSFADYMLKMRDIIASARVDLNENSQAIIAANSPFEFKPTLSPAKQGILMIHGLFDSPFTQRDLGHYFASKGFLVRSILLPGHGTVPGDLLTVRYQEWLKAVHYGIESLRQSVNQIYIASFSLGAALALYQALTRHDIKGLILLAPALKANLSVMLALCLPMLLNRLFHHPQWYKIRQTTNYVKYEALPYNAAYQSYCFINKLNRLLKKSSLTIPAFIVANVDDETVNTPAIINFLDRCQHPNNRLLIYTNAHMKLSDNRIMIRPSAFPTDDIVNFSHTCLPIAPSNSIYGKNSHYRDFNHYQRQPQGKIYFGAATKDNLKNHTIARLSYNPDFDGMIKEIDKFLAAIA